MDEKGQNIGEIVQQCGGEGESYATLMRKRVNIGLQIYEGDLREKNKPLRENGNGDRTKAGEG